MSGLPLSAVLNPATVQHQPVQQSRFTDNGREYYTRWFDTYPHPCDEAEKERLDALHTLFYDVALEGHLHIATLRTGRLRILDIGYGTGIWAIEMAQKYPQAEVIAIDIGNDHPIVDGFDFRVDFHSGVDFTSDHWGLEHLEGTFDLVHAAQLCGSVRDWASFYGKVIRLLKPGSGQFEQVELDWKPLCSDPNMPQNSPVFQWWHWMRLATGNMRKLIDYPDNQERVLEDVGFDVLKHNRVDVHASMSPKFTDTDHHNALATWYRHTMWHPAYKTIGGMCNLLFTRQLGWSQQQISALCIDVQREMNRPGCPWYHKFHVVTAKRRG